MAEGGEDLFAGGFEGAGDGVAAGADVAAAAEGLGDAGDIDASLAAQADPVVSAAISRKKAVASMPWMLSAQLTSPSQSSPVAPQPPCRPGRHASTR